jgi:hypothetical protein
MQLRTRSRVAWNAMKAVPGAVAGAIITKARTAGSWAVEPASNRRLLGRLETGLSTLLLCSVVVFVTVPILVYLVLLAVPVSPTDVEGAVLRNSYWPMLLRLLPDTALYLVAGVLALDFSLKVSRIVVTRNSDDVRRAFLTILVAGALLSLERMRNGLGDSLERLHERREASAARDFSVALQQYRERADVERQVRQTEVQARSWDYVRRTYGEDFARAGGKELDSAQRFTVAQMGEKFAERVFAAAPAAPLPPSTEFPVWIAVVDWAGPFVLSFAAVVLLLATPPKRAARHRRNSANALQAQVERDPNPGHE